MDNTEYTYERDINEMPEFETFETGCAPLEWVLDKAELPDEEDRIPGEINLYFRGNLPGRMAAEIREWIRTGGKDELMKKYNYVGLSIGWGEYMSTRNKISVSLSDYRGQAWLHGRDDIKGVKK